MLPKNSDRLPVDFVYQQPSSKTFRMNLTGNRIAGKIDRLEAMRQAVYLMLNVERYQYLIHSWDYGVELQDLIGRHPDLAIPEIKRRISEALLRDSRITGVHNFIFNIKRGKVHVTFQVDTVFGAFDEEREVVI